MPDATPATGLEPRALATFRVGLGALVAADGLMRLPDAYPLYTDHGVLPREEAIRQFGFLLEPALSVHMGAGSTLWAGALLLAQVLVGLLLAVGWRTGTVAVLAYALLAGVQLRNLFVGGGYDAMLRLCVLWAGLAPVSRVWSVDAVHHPPETPAAPARDLGSLGLFLQVVIVYVAAGAAKLAEPSWRSGEALGLILQDEVHVRPIGHVLAGLPALTALGTHLTAYVELLWPLALLVPVARGPVRTATLGLLAALTLAFVAFLRVDFFPFIAVVGLCALLPTWLFDRAGLGVERFAPRALAARLPPGPAPSARSRRAAQLVAVPLLAFTLVWNVGVARDPSYQGPALVSGFGRALFLQQGWRMFAEPASRTGWVTAHGRTLEGRPVDLLARGGPSPAALPVASLAPEGRARRTPRNFRWMVLLKRIGYGFEGAASEFSRYHCREWNTLHTGDARLSTLEITFHNRPVPTAPDAPYAPEVVWIHDCLD